MANYSIFSNTAPVTGTVIGGYGAVPPSGTLQITGVTGASYTTTASAWNPVLTSNGTSGALQVSGDADIKGNLTVKGANITDILQQIQDRLCILVPDPKLLDKYEALKQAYEHYKLLEALCVDVDSSKK
jgi:hypothetical protein